MLGRKLRGSKITIAEAKRDLLSDNDETRGQAVSDLMIKIKKEPSVRPEALQIFRQVMKTETNPWPICLAASGIEFIEGSEAGWSAWKELLAHPSPKIAAWAAMSVQDDSVIVPVLLKMLETRLEVAVQVSVMRKLGRIGDPSALAPLVARLQSPELLPDAIQALDDLSDPQAIPYLEPFLANTEDLWREDERGAMLTVADIAALAINHIRMHPKGGESVPLTPDQFAKPLPEFIPTPHSAPTIPDPSPSQIEPITPPSVKPRAYLPAYIPVLCAILDIPWFIAVMAWYMIKHGTKITDVGTSRFLDSLFLGPALFGFLVGVVLIIRRPVMLKTERFFLWLGTLLCLLILFTFGNSFLDPLVSHGVTTHQFKDGIEVK